LINAGRQVLGLARSDSGANSLSAAGAQVHRGDVILLDKTTNREVFYSNSNRRMDALAATGVDTSASSSISGTLPNGRRFALVLQVPLFQGDGSMPT
jgi:hypothetical protein